MGFQQKIVISSAASAGVRRAVLAAAFTRWPSARAPRNDDTFPDRAVFAPPELTSYLFDDDGQWDDALAQNAEVENDLPEWSRAFPGLSFAFIEADCFGGYCEYSGYCCQDGEVLHRKTPASSGSLEALAAGVGIEIAGPFAPFVRGFFAGRCSGGPAA